LEDEAMNRIEGGGAGEYGDNDIGEGFFTMYMYGCSAAQRWNIEAGLCNFD
jgi:hypothetical protein